MFNLKAAKKETVDTQESRLQRDRDQHALPNPVGNGDWLLKGVRKDEKLALVEKELASKREGTKDVKLTEGQLNAHEPPKGYPKRDGTNESAKMPPLAAVNAAQEAERLKAYKKAEDKEADTEFWDKYLGVQMVTPKTKTPKQVTDTQLQNDADRVKGSTEGTPDQSKIKDVVMASIKDADAMLYFIHRKAADENRELTEKEKMMVASISVDKEKFISSL